MSPKEQPSGGNIGFVTSILNNHFIYKATVTSPKLQHCYYCNHVNRSIISPQL